MALEYEKYEVSKLPYGVEATYQIHLHLSSHRIICSNTFKFVVGPFEKEYTVHGAAISSLSRPLDVLLNGPMKEAEEKLVNWPEVDDKTFVRFVQWAYTRDYVPPEPTLCADRAFEEVPDPVSQKEESTDDSPLAEQPLYSLIVYKCAEDPGEQCSNRNCGYYGQSRLSKSTSVQCLTCRGTYDSKNCSSCSSATSDCPRCGHLTTIQRYHCSNEYCTAHNGNIHPIEEKDLTCIKCKRKYNTTCCKQCDSAFIDCPSCAANATIKSKRINLINKFLDESGTRYPAPTSSFLPRENTGCHEDYTDIFLCHAQLYTIGDKYDIPTLRELTLHRLHATLRDFTLYPSRMKDIATLVKYIFENTVPGDTIREMVMLYYACIIEDASMQDELKELVDDIPDFAFNLISMMINRLA